MSKDSPSTKPSKPTLLFDKEKLDSVISNHVDDEKKSTWDRLSPAIKNMSLWIGDERWSKNKEAVILIVLNDDFKKKKEYEEYIAGVSSVIEGTLGQADVMQDPKTKAYYIALKPSEAFKTELELAIKLEEAKRLEEAERSKKARTSVENSLITFLKSNTNFNKKTKQYELKFFTKITPGDKTKNDIKSATQLLMSIEKPMLNKKSLFDHLKEFNTYLYSPPTSLSKEFKSCLLECQEALLSSLTDEQFEEFLKEADKKNHEDLQKTFYALKWDRIDHNDINKPSGGG